MHKQFDASIADALNQFKEDQYIEKLKTHITSESIPSDKEHLLEFLYNLVIHIWWHVAWF